MRGVIEPDEWRKLTYRIYDMLESWRNDDLNDPPSWLFGDLKELRREMRDRVRAEDEGRVSEPELNAYASVRFPVALADAAKRAAACDGSASVSEWIRRMVEQEVRRRDGRCPACGAQREGLAQK